MGWTIACKKPRANKTNSSGFSPVDMIVKRGASHRYSYYTRTAQDHCIGLLPIDDTESSTLAQSRFPKYVATNKVPDCSPQDRGSGR